MDDPVKIRFAKWGDIPHWTFDMFRLGEDEHVDGVRLVGEVG